MKTKPAKLKKWLKPLSHVLTGFWRPQTLKKPEFLELNNQIKMYPWGSTQWIPQFLGKENLEAMPWAELWMGIHPEAPSTTWLKNRELSLYKIIKNNPAYYLGEQGVQKFNSLPFLFKLLAAERPLSIQAHPDLSRAKEGFQRENLAGLAPDAPNRNYRDPNHKPEIICALTPFTGMCGFRQPAEIRELLNDFLTPSGLIPPDKARSLSNGMAPLLDSLENTDISTALKNFLHALFSLSADMCQELSDYIIRESTRRLTAPDQETLSLAHWEKMVYFTKLYPDDPAVISPLYLNLFSLEPGEAVFLQSGTLHSYIHGFGLELMANSDNVLRGGLTSKHIDINELINILDFNPIKPEIIKPPGPDINFTYPTRCSEFSLSVMHGTAIETEFCNSGPAICIVSSGELEICGKQDRAIFRKGQSVFIPPARQPLVFRGNYTIYAATIGL